MTVQCGRHDASMFDPKGRTHHADEHVAALFRRCGKHPADTAKRPVHAFGQRGMYDRRIARMSALEIA